MDLRGELQPGAELTWERVRLAEFKEWPAWAVETFSVAAQDTHVTAWDETANRKPTLSIATFLDKEFSKRVGWGGRQPHRFPTKVVTGLSVAGSAQHRLTLDGLDASSGMLKGNLGFLIVTLQFKAGGDDALPRQTGVLDASTRSQVEMSFDAERLPVELDPAPLMQYLTSPIQYQAADLEGVVGLTVMPAGRPAGVVSDVGLQIVSQSSREAPTKIRLDLRVGVRSLTVTGLKDTQISVAGRQHPISPDQKIVFSLAAGDLGWLTVHGDEGFVFRGRVDSVRINGEDLRPYAVDEWPWYIQTLFGVVLTFLFQKAAPLWRRRPS